MPQTIMVSQLMEMLESIGLQDEWEWRWKKLRELIDAAEQKRVPDARKACPHCSASVLDVEKYYEEE